jgi:hypothetical protein
MNQVSGQTNIQGQPDTGELTKKQKEKKLRDEYVETVRGKLDESLLQDKETRAQKKGDQTDILGWEAERLAKLVADQSNSIHVSKDSNPFIDDTRALLREADPTPNAVLSKFDKVRQRLIQAYDSRINKQNWFWTLFIMILCFFLAAAVIIGVLQLIPGQQRLENTLWVCLACALWGAIGSTIDAFSAMYKHFGKQDFDLHYLPWYFVHPFLGMGIGAVVYLILQAGMLSLGGVGLQESGNSTAFSANATIELINKTLQGEGPTKSIGVTALPIALAFLGGFRQSAVMNFLTRLVSSFFPPTDKDTIP